MKQEKVYHPKKVEEYVQKYWETHKTFRTNIDRRKEKFYCLSMFPYPSGKLHMGHVRNYTIGDVIARCQRMLGKNVLHPIGWDSFGLPAENAAIRNNISASRWTTSNIGKMKKQLKKLGFSYDWSREISTCNPKYYRWEQWFFTKLYKKGLVYKKFAEVNWCPTDKTVLANEQVVDGLCWNCDETIERKNQLQWFVKITEYSEELLQGLKYLKKWPEKVKTMQKNWIGKTDGFEIQFHVPCKKETLFVYVEKENIYTIMGISCIYIASNHPLVLKIFKKDKKIWKFVKTCQKIQISEGVVSTIAKEGVFSNLYAIHPVTKENIPIWIVNFILVKDNINIKLSVPSLNYEDYKFSQKYNIPYKEIISWDSRNKNILRRNFPESIRKDEILKDVEKYDVITTKEMNLQIIRRLISLKLAKKKIRYRLRDWEVSRQRLWGVRIPIASNKGDTTTVPRKYLPILSYEDRRDHSKNFSNLSDTNGIKKDSILIKGKKLYLEKDTLDTFVQSSWYYARYTCPNYNKGMLNKKIANYWLPVDQYIGGIEHSTMHLLYIRFFHKLMRDEGLLSSDEPVINLLCQGMILSDAFYVLDNEKKRIWISSDRVVVKRDRYGKIVESRDHEGNPVIHGGMMKMSKSKNNGVDPETIIEQYGADTVRLFIMFIAPVEMNIEWNNSQMIGAHRFVKKLWKIVLDNVSEKSNVALNIDRFNEKQVDLYVSLQKTIKKVTHDMIHQFCFNTAISEIMKLVKKISHYHGKDEQDAALVKEILNKIILMLFPIIPHVCFVLWKSLGNYQNIDHERWPSFDEDYIRNNTTRKIILQINGKFIDKIVFKRNNISEREITSFVQKRYPHLKSCKIRKTIYIRSKLINILIDRK
ncbi:leucine--tRNA ligase [Candidatus Riesia pediculischaeffi]|uniref:Leucine--tRNA ligase n=1 Tax=Candidatus Riesia pediculischaeffi TaxID=428411 RepID=A0A1V0HL46_9ENTR|nr:leucine--tRNA ligase [Candidatus Riesia pediculischaeffi]ARC53544.1 leucine--tRNA ligase [Candidatus Riesia pediculischaeffi]